MRHTNLVAAAMTLVVVGGPHFGHAQERDGPATPPGWRRAPEYVRLFAPRGLHTDAYKAYVSPDSLATLLARLASDPLLLRPPGAWTQFAELPLEAFGQTGRYDRGRLARLYGSSRVQVARGPRGPEGRPSEAWTLVSPYPDRDLERLEPGTLLIVLNLERN